MTEQYFITIVGEMGMSPTEFYNLSPFEADLMIDGYKRRLEQNNNVIFNACLNANGLIHCKDYKIQPLFDAPQDKKASREEELEYLEYMKNMMITAGENLG